MIGMARDAGFDHESTADLTPLLSSIDRATGRSPSGVALLKRLPFTGERYDYVIGGDALQTCLTKGWIRYSSTSFELDDLIHGRNLGIVSVCRFGVGVQIAVEQHVAAHPEHAITRPPAVTETRVRR